MSDGEGFFQLTARNAGLMKGTTVVDNDLIETAFLVGAGVAGGFLTRRLEISEADAQRTLVELMGLLERCIQAANCEP